MRRWGRTIDRRRMERENALNNNQKYWKGKLKDCNESIIMKGISNYLKNKKDARKE